MTSKPPDDLAAELLGEVPNASSNFWATVDQRLGSGHERGQVSPTLVPQDITALPVASPGSRSRRFAPLGIAAAIVLLVGGFFALRAVSQPTEEIAQNPMDLPRDERPGPTANRDHWHAAYGVWDCTANDGDGAWVEPFQSTRDDYGIHSHGQGMIYIHPFVDEAALDNATFSLFAETMGIVVDDDRLVLDDGTELTEGATCNGEPAQLRLLRWEFDLRLRSNPALPPLVVTENFGAERFYNDREVWVLAFAPADAEIPSLPFDRFRELDKWLNGSVPVPPPSAEDRVDLAGNIPIADIYMGAAPGAGLDPIATTLFELRSEANHVIDAPDPDPGTIDHLSTLNAGSLRRLDIFRYRSATSECVAALSTSFRSPGGETLCFDPSDSTEIAISDNTDYVPGQSLAARNVVVVSNPPSDAEWMIIFTDKGERIAASVVNDIIYAEWHPRNGKATRVQLLNATLDQLWTSTDL